MRTDKWRNKKTWQSILLLVGITMISVSGCTKPDPYIPPKEGEVVTWKKNSQLVLKARLGQRREHIPDTHCTRCEAEFYNKKYDRYLGQFPIDYVPERFEKLTQAEVEKMPIAVSNNGAFEFSLMLNGAKAKVTDKSIYSETALDDINQVKVQIEGRGVTEEINFTTKDGYEHFLKFKNGVYDRVKSAEYGLKCYLRNDALVASYWCFGKSSNPNVSGFAISFTSDGEVTGESWEAIYGGIRLRWRIDRRNAKYAKEVEAAIWRLLESWNVSPLDTEIKQ